MRSLNIRKPNYSLLDITCVHDNNNNTDKNEQNRTHILTYTIRQEKNHDI